MITIIDYDMGNVGSLLNMIKYVGGDVKISSSPDEISESNKIILPGVGRMDTGMAKLKQSGIDNAIFKAIKFKKAKMLGICLGMHLLFEHSEEGNINGLGLIKGKVIKFKFSEDKKLKIPHMGWNSVAFSNESSFFSKLKENKFFYFVHSYYVECQNERDIAGVCNYGFNFTSAIQNLSLIHI